MAVDGVRVLKSLTLRCCTYGGSSSGMREFLGSDIRKDFESKQDHIKVQEVFAARYTDFKGNRHPGIIAEFDVDGQITTQQIGVRNYTPDQILETLNYLANKRPGKSRSWNEKYRHYTRRPSIQGVWHPDQWTTLQEVPGDFQINKE